MYHSVAKVQKAFVPWYSLQQKTIESFYKKVRGNRPLENTPENLRDFLISKFPKIEWEFHADGCLKSEHLAAYIALAEHWCCKLYCTKAQEIFKKMNELDKNIIGTILQEITGNENGIDSISLKNIISESGWCINL